jgi:hypothetical protein
MGPSGIDVLDARAGAEFQRNLVGKPTAGEGVTRLLDIHPRELILIVRNSAVTDGSGSIPAYCIPLVFQIN